MEQFVSKHRDKINATLSCFDRVIFKGHLPIGYPEGMENFLGVKGILLKNFKHIAPKQAERLKAHAQAMAGKAGRPYLYLERPASVRKEDLARKIAQEDKITKGLICILAAVEPCKTFKIEFAKKRPRLRSAFRKCLTLYFYFLDRTFGFMHVRIQTWFPFTIQVYVNGHDWLARKMDLHGMKYLQIDNSFFRIQDPKRAQRLADKFTSIKWHRVLDSFARKVNPLLRDLLEGLCYYWVTDQAEFATDIIFHNHASLQSLYPKLLEHATLCFSAEDVLTFLGRKLHWLFAGEVLNDFKKKRWPGARVKHRMKENWIKMYDKHGVVLRIETVINRPYEFKTRRQGRRKGELIMGWFPMTKGVANLYRYAEVSRTANQRYLEALAVIDDPRSLQRSLHKLAEPSRKNGRPFRGFNPLSKQDIQLFNCVLRGEHFISGFRNSDIRRHMFTISNNSLLERRRSAKISRLLKRLHVHGLIAKIPHSRRWHVTQKGHALMSTSIKLFEKHFPESINKAA